MSEALQIARDLNCQGLSCPLPIIKTKKEIDGMEAGEILRMTATDPGSVNDMAAWVAKTGHELVEQAQEAGIYTYYIRKVG